MMTGSPYAKVGDVLEVDLPRPRTRLNTMEHPDFYKYRGHLLNFLDE